MIPSLKQLNVRIPENLRNRVREEVVSRWGYDIKGGTAGIVIEALEKYFIAPHTHTQKPQPKNELGESLMLSKFSPKIHTIVRMIKTYAKEDGSIQPETLKRAINKALNVYDDRTVSKYITILINMQLLYAYSDKGIYELNLPEVEIIV